MELESRMKLKKVISGGQTGADRTGLECAKALGLETGGWAPRGFRIDGGVDPSLADFGLKETASNDYPTRTFLNVQDSDITVWFGGVSPGYKCTEKACKKHGKVLVFNPNGAEMLDLANRFEVINVAGNRLRTNPGIVGVVKLAFEALELRVPGCRCLYKPCRCPRSESIARFACGLQLEDDDGD